MRIDAVPWFWPSRVMGSISIGPCIPGHTLPFSTKTIRPAQWNWQQQKICLFLLGLWWAVTDDNPTPMEPQRKPSFSATNDPDSWGESDSADYVDSRNDPYEAMTPMTAGSLSGCQAVPVDLDWYSRLCGQNNENPIWSYDIIWQWHRMTPWKKIWTARKFQTLCQISVIRFVWYPTWTCPNMFRLFFMAPKFVQRTGSFWTFIHGGGTGNWMEVHSGILKDCSNSRNHQTFSIRSRLSAFAVPRVSALTGCLQSKRARGQVPRVPMACPQSHHPIGKGDMGESWSLYTIRKNYPLVI
jgi:hypothetical protein